MKKRFFFAFILALCLFSAMEIYAEEVYPPIEVSKFHSSFQYYGLPLQLKIGWLYRYDDVSIFPNGGVRFSVNEEVELGVSTGFIFQADFFSWSVNTYYNAIPFTIGKSAEEQVYFLENNFLFSLPFGRAYLPGSVGRKEVLQISQNNDSKVVATVFQQGIGLDLFLIDAGFLKSTASSIFSLQSIPESSFFSYEIGITIPTTFSLYHLDLAFMYQFLQSDDISIGNSSSNNMYNVGNTWGSVSGRTSLSTDAMRYTTIHSGELELRWYVLRQMNPFSQFFVSLFSQLGCGINAANGSSLLYEYGLGFGYNFFDSAPFTFQIGFDKDFKPVFYLNLVSKIMHNP